jgi:uncharacterized membrane protein YidH (DUF202 family)
MKESVLRESAEETVDPRVDLAVLRTELAEDRTLLSWARTSLGLMGAGVAFDKGTQWLHEARLAAGSALVHNGHVVGITLTIITTVLLGVVLWQCLRRVTTRSSQAHSELRQ